MADIAEADRVVPRSGNMAIGPQLLWFGLGRTRQQVRFWIDTHHHAPDHRRVADQDGSVTAVGDRTCPLRQAGASPAGAASGLAHARRHGRDQLLQVQRLVNSSGILILANQVISSAHPGWPGSTPASA